MTRSQHSGEEPLEVNIAILDDEPDSTLHGFKNALVEAGMGPEEPERRPSVVFGDCVRAPGADRAADFV